MPPCHPLGARCPAGQGSTICLTVLKEQSSAASVQELLSLWRVPLWKPSKTEQEHEALSFPARLSL